MDEEMRAMLGALRAMAETAHREWADFDGDMPRRRMTPGQRVHSAFLKGKLDGLRLAVRAVELRSHTLDD